MNSIDHFRLANLQAVIFTPDVASFNKPRFIANVLRHHAEQFNGDIQSLPFPPGDPKLSAFHLVEFSSSDQQWTLKAASGRIDAHWKRPQAVERVEKAAIVRAAIAPLLDYVRDCSVQVGRLALVLNRFAAVDDPSHALIRRFCIAETWDSSSTVAPLRNSQAFEIHNLKKYLLMRDTQVNSWVRCRTGAANGRPAVLFEQDINTLAEESQESAMAPSQIEEFFDAAVSDADRILQLYFPAGIGHAGL